MSSGYEISVFDFVWGIRVLGPLHACHGINFCPTNQSCCWYQSFNWKGKMRNLCNSRQRYSNKISTTFVLSTYDFLKYSFVYTSFELITVIASIILEVRQWWFVSFLFLSVTSPEKTSRKQKIGRLPAAAYAKYRVNWIGGLRPPKIWNIELIEFFRLFKTSYLSS